MTEFNYEHWKCVEITLPYFKQGDDIDHYIHQTESLEEALELHAEAMDAAAKQLRRIKEIIGGREVSISGMTHMIFLSPSRMSWTAWWKQNWRTCTRTSTMMTKLNQITQIRPIGRVRAFD